MQRVSAARVEVGDRTVAEIGTGLLVFIAVERGDTEQESDRLLERVLGYRVFNDDKDRMNCTVADVGGGLLLVSQFTLAADTKKGMRPGFSPAASPDEGKRLFDHFVAAANRVHPIVQTGEFGAHMRVTLTNDGPVTFWLHAKQPAGRT